MKKHIACLTLLTLFICHPVMAADPEIPVDSRIKILTYSPSDVYMLTTKTGYQTSIEFARNEEITTISVGDRSPWQIIPNGNRIFIRPLVDDVATNMTVITNIREYHFDIKAIGEKQTNNIYVAQFRYPQDEKTMPETLNDMETVVRPKPVVLHTSETPVQPITPAPEPAPVAEPTPTPAPAATRSSVSIAPLDTQRTKTLNTNYTYTGPDEIAPNQVYDDGRNTYILYERIPSPTPRPFVGSANGDRVIANHRVIDNKIVMFSVAKGFVLKGDQGDVVVYNESLGVQP